MTSFRDALRLQRWDDHRYYHHSRINQSLHLVSATSFLVAYAVALVDPAVSALIAWLVSMPSRQAGPFFFAPKGYAHVNAASPAHKAEIKVGYNLFRKVVLMAVWAVSPLLLVWDPTLLGVFAPHATTGELVRHVGLLWLAVGAGGLVVRVLQLFVIRDVGTGITWAAKILTDPFHDVRLYWRAPLALLHGELIDRSLRDEVEAELAARGSAT